MKIRLFRKIQGIGIILPIAFMVFNCGAPATIRNVVVILADDHARHVSGLYGNPIIQTPNIDKLAIEGITFHNAYCNAPICSASRQSLLTGKYPHATGVNLLFTPFPDEGNITIAEHLRLYNYKTAIIGKTHWNN
ncbi:MAG: sulfatase-like hydrolase/transferase [Cyclobacteriaceae bacterium]|nr:sulfatase-like hydrolase/transferase [Cyclobacteriaceae bacterium]